jgi:hypothetical protein
MKTGRNDPCTCGSGKKYKHCCLRGAPATVSTPADFARQRLRALTKNLPAELLRFATNRFGPETIDDAWSDFLGEEAAFDPDTHHFPLFMPWFFHRWSLPVRTGSPSPEARGTTVSGEYLARRRRNLNPLLVRWIEACGATPFSFHEVVSVEPGRGLETRDILQGTVRFVIDHSASGMLHAHDILFAQVVTLDDLSLFEGMGPAIIPPRHKLEIIELRARLGTRDDLFGETILTERENELLDVYLRLADRLLSPRMPELQNTDGEPLEFRTLRFRVADAETTVANLDMARLADGESLWRDDEPPIDSGDLRARAAAWTWSREGNAMHKNWDNTTLGRIALNGDKLTVEVNSVGRAERARALIERLLGSNATYQATEIQSVESAIAETRDKKGNRSSADVAAEHERLMQLPEVKRRVAEMMQQHYTAWLDTKLPILRQRTPREAVRTADGREAVEALLVDLERRAQTGTPQLDPEILAMLRRELGLETKPALPHRPDGDAGPAGDRGSQ